MTPEKAAPEAPAKEAKEAEAAKPKPEAEIKAEGRKPQPRERPETEKAAGARSFLAESLALARRLEVDQILVVTEAAVSMEVLGGRQVKKKIIVATSSEKFMALCEEKGIRAERIPAYAFDRFEKIKVAIAGCTSKGLLEQGMRVLCLAGQAGSAQLDTALLVKIGEHSDDHAVIGMLHSGTGISPQVLEAVLNVALTIGFEGFEGQPVGTILVVGDTTAVMEKSRQLTLNPFQGYSEDEKNILDPRVRDAIRSFCMLDGAFIIREDGVVLAAGRYLRVPEGVELQLPLGLGTRHAAAMYVTKASNSVAFVVSKTTGSVRIYKKGELAAELRQPRRRA
jgi:diadenylate cyclase